MTFNAAALFPLALAGALAGMSYWLDRATTVGELGAKAKARHSPDYIVEKFNVQRYDATGSLLQSLKAQKMTHYPDDETTDVVAPELIYHRAEAPTTVTAKTAQLTKDGKEVRLRGAVKVSRPRTSTRPATLIQTEALTVFPDEERASGNAPVTLTQGNNVVQGGAITYYGKERIAHLSGGVHGTFKRGSSN